MTLYWNGDKVKESLKGAVLQGAIKTAEDILRESNELAPWDTGTMVRSSFVYRNGNKIYISYNTPYAYVQHEDLHWDKKTRKLVSMKLNHPKGGAKFLEKAWNKEIKNLDKNIQAETKKAGLL